MKKKAAHKQLTCSSCHASHKYATKVAAIDSCMNCHNDQHTLAFKKSPHSQLAVKEQSGKTKPGSGVTCATCHMPRTPETDKPGALVTVQHNQNDNLRPNEKMIRSVCLSCHGLRFSIDALADPKLIKIAMADTQRVNFFFPIKSYRVSGRINSIICTL